MFYLVFYFHLLRSKEIKIHILLLFNYLLIFDTKNLFNPNLYNRI